MSRVGLAVLALDTYSSNESACTAGFPPMMSTCSTALILSNKALLAGGTQNRADVVSSKVYPGLQQMSLDMHMHYKIATHGTSLL